MAILNSLKSFWAADATLTAALPVSKVYLDWIPPGTIFPYARVSVISSVPMNTTGAARVETFTFQIAVFHTNFDTACSIADTIQDRFDRVQITSPTLRVFRTNRLYAGEVINGVYTYNIIQEFEWLYNSTGT